MTLCDPPAYSGSLSSRLFCEKLRNSSDRLLVWSKRKSVFFSVKVTTFFHSYTASGARDCLRGKEGLKGRCGPWVCTITQTIEDEKSSRSEFQFVFPGFECCGADNGLH